MMFKQFRSLFFFTLLMSVSGILWAAETDTGTTAWMLTSTTLVLLMVPGLAMFYGGLVRTKNVVGTMMHSFVSMAIIGVLWAVCGYALAFGPNVLGGWVGWNPDFVLLKGLDDSIMEGGVPELVFAMFQGKFAIITPALIAGAFAEELNSEDTVFLLRFGVFSFICRFVIGFGRKMVFFLIWGRMAQLISRAEQWFTFPRVSAR